MTLLFCTSLIVNPQSPMSWPEPRMAFGGPNRGRFVAKATNSIRPMAGALRGAKRPTLPMSVPFAGS